MRRKLRRRTGFTLAETLIAVMILALVTAAGTAGVTAVLAVRNRMIQVSNAQVLASAAAEAVADELRFGRGIEAAKNKVTMDSSLFDRGCTLRLSTGGTGEYKTPAGRTVPAGRLVMERTETAGADPVLREVLGGDMYRDLHFSDLTFTVDKTGTDDATVAVHLTVADTGGRDLWSADFTVVPLNGAGSAAAGG